MEPKEFLAFLARLEKLKCNTRHSWTSSGRHESVAEHSWRLAMLAMLLRDALPEVDMDKVLRMCLIHDVGEAVTGDIPSFQKTDANEETERQAIAELLSPLPDGLRGELTALFAEMDALATPEARVYKALDKLEVVVTFLAVLELMKIGKIHLSQEETFGDMDIETLEQEGEEEELDLAQLGDFEG